MKIFVLIIISLITIFLCIDTDFNIVYKSNSEENQFINLIDNIFLEVELTIGSNEDKFKLELDLSNYCTTIPDAELEVQNIKKFNKSLSTSFKEIKKVNFVFLEKFATGVVGEDTIKLGNGDSINNINIIVASFYSYSFENSYSYMGLSLKNGELNLDGLNILEQLKNKNITNKQIWYLEFSDFNKGKLFLGKFPHENDSKRYNEENKYSTYLDKSFGVSYRIAFDEIYYGNINKYESRETMQVHNTTIISLSTRLIYSTYEYGEMIKKKFFDKKIEDKICYSQTFKDNNKYFYFYCEKDKIDISKMDNLNFFIRDTKMTFEFEPKDLFYEHNNYLYYLIVFKKLDVDDGNKDIEWKLGLTFLQKYTLAFDRNDKLVYYYNSFKDEDNTNKKDNNNNKDNNNPENINNNNIEPNNTTKYIIIICLLVAVFICAVFFLVYIIIKIKPRKIKVNELDDQYDYDSNNLIN